MDGDVMPDLLRWAEQTRPSLSGSSTPRTPGSFTATPTGVTSPEKNSNNNLSGVTQVVPAPTGSSVNKPPIIQPTEQAQPVGWLDLIFQYWALRPRL